MSISDNHNSNDSIVQIHNGSGDNVGTKIVYESENIEDILTPSWFKRHIESGIENLGKRYTPELNVKLEVSKNFDAICRNDSFREIVRESFHEFILKVNKAKKDYLSIGAKEDTCQIDAEIQEIEAHFLLLQKKEVVQIEIDSIKESVCKIKNELTECVKKIEDYKEVRKETVDYTKRSINEAWDAIYNFTDFINGPILRLSNNPTAILTGPAGIGKSHLLADVVSKRLEENKLSILLLGQHFTSEVSPWTQLLNNLLRLNCDEHKLLSILNDKAQAQGERLIFIVDAINEGKGRYFWPDHINSFINDFSGYPWISLVLSVRDSYGACKFNCVNISNSYNADRSIYEEERKA